MLRLPTGQSAITSITNATYIPTYTMGGASMVSSSYMAHLTQEETERQNNYVKYREYYDGDHDTLLTERLKKFLSVKGDDQEFNFNVCPIVVDALSERLKVTGFSAGDQGEILWNWWEANKMDAQQGIVHTSANRDGDTYEIVEWDNENKRPTFTHELACTGGEGVKVHYSKEKRGVIESASKRWVVEQGNNAGKVRRLNLYFADHIEKYISTEGEFEGNYRPYLEDGGVEMPGELGSCGWFWWTDNGTASGKPLGVPVVHFKNKDQGYDWGQSELKDIIPVQNALNKSVIDLLGSADYAGFRLLVAVGDTFEGMKVYPGAVWNSQRPSNEVDVKSIEGEDPSKLIAVVDKFVISAAQISRTPISYFQSTGQRPAEGTLKQEESGLVAKAKKCQTDFGNAWEQCMAIARRLNNAFGSAKMDETQTISTEWEEPQTRDELQHLQVLALKKQLGIPETQIWREMGYNDKQIREFQREKKKAQAEAIKQFAMAGGPTVPGQQQKETENGNEKPGQPAGQQEKAA